MSDSIANGKTTNAGTSGQFKEIANNIYDQYADEHDAESHTQKDIEKNVGSKSQHDDDLVEHLSEKQDGQTASVKGSRVNLDEPRPEINPAEIGKSLRELHSKVDEVLRKTPHGRKDMYYSMAGTTVTDREKKLLNAGQSVVEPLVRNYPYSNPFNGSVDPRLYDSAINRATGTPLRDSRVINQTGQNDPNYMKYSLSVSKHDRPYGLPQEDIKYDKEKLDSIVANILRKQGINYVPQPETRVPHDMTSSKYSGFYAQEENRSQVGKRSAMESMRQSQKIEEPKPYYCGELENDEDSIIIGYAQKADDEQRKKYTYYCGVLEDDDN